MFLALPIHLFKHFCCMMYRLATMHNITRQTDGQTDANNQSHCVQHNRLITQ